MLRMYATQLCRGCALNVQIHANFLLLVSGPRAQLNAIDSWVVCPSQFATGPNYFAPRRRQPLRPRHNLTFSASTGVETTNTQRIQQHAVFCRLAPVFSK